MKLIPNWEIEDSHFKIIIHGFIPLQLVAIVVIFLLELEGYSVNGMDYRKYLSIALTLVLVNSMSSSDETNHRKNELHYVIVLAFVDHLVKIVFKFIISSTFF